MDNTDNDNLKVFVSRLPNKWRKEHLQEHFEACFGKVIDAYVRLDQRHENSMGFGFVTFESEESKRAAVDQGSMHVMHRTIQIREVSRDEKDESETSNSICFAWQKFCCVKGDSCKFKHEGPGKCITASAFGEGKTKKCISFKKTGKCSKGDGCPFQHIRSANSEGFNAEAKVKAPAPAVVGKKGLCHSFAKKGKCRKGDACMFSHDIPVSKPVPSASASADSSGKRKIDGKVLVQKRRKLLVGAEGRDEHDGGAGLLITGDE
jgi:hypothetical protein